MNFQQIIQLGVRLFAIFIAAESFEYLIKIPSKLEGMGSPKYHYVSYWMGAFYLSVAICLWFFPYIVSKRIIPKSDQSKTTTLNAFDFARAGSGLIGLWLMATALPSISWFIFRGAAYAVTNQSIVSALEPEDQIRLGYYSVQFVTSILLIAYARKFAYVICSDIKTTDATGN